MNYTGPGITTQGGDGIGILALSGGGSINVTSFVADHDKRRRALGIVADSGTI